MKRTLLTIATAICLTGIFSSCAEDTSHGLTASYYNNAFWVLQPVKTRIIPNVDLIWFSDEEKPMRPPFGIVMEGKLTVPESGNITFFLASDDGSILQIDGQTVIDNNGFHPVTEKSATLNLSQGQHNIVVKYNELQGGSEVHLSWTLPGGDREIIGSQYFQPVDPSVSAYAGKSYPLPKTAPPAANPADSGM